MYIAHTFLFSRRKQWLMIDISYFKMMIRRSNHILIVTKIEVGKQKKHSPIYCINIMKRSEINVVGKENVYELHAIVSPIIFTHHKMLSSYGNKNPGS